MMIDKQCADVNSGTRIPGVFSVKCRYCGILLVGREQFVGHMFHAHEFRREQLEAAWESITMAQRLGNVRNVREEVIR
ncbi:MAG TPA: hypothetical protein VNI77_08495 [Nitrososphaera sp.]|nr:hypothetical protein [Nitrososphaera sp.]